MSYKKDSITNDDIGQLVREMETNYVNGVTSQSKYVQFSMYEDIQKTDAYLNSKHTSGDTDSQDREKPFFNIVTAACNIWYRATDIDRKNIKIRPTKAKDTVSAFLATIHLQDWMRRERFGAFLNEWGRVLARYGSAVCKFVEKEDKLSASVVPWQRMIVDQVDFDANPKIEILELTEAQLYQRKGYDQDMVEKLCDARKARELLDGHNIDSKSDYIKLYEVHGNLPKSYLTGKEKDGDTYVQQMHVITFVASKEQGKYDDFTLASGRERIDPYMITHLIKEDGQTLANGAVKHLFEAQWMMNHTTKAIKDQLDLASKLIFQTSDGNFVGQNALNAIETGDILVHKENQPLTQVANNSHDVSALQNYAAQWKTLSNEITGISESMLGNAAPSGTAWRQVEALLQQNQTLFELMTENKGLDVEKMLRDHTIPYLKKKLDTKDEVVAVLEAHEIHKIDSAFINNVSIKIVNRRIVDTILDGGVLTAEDQQAMLEAEQNGLKEGLASQGNQRFFKPSELDDKTWKDVFKDFEWECEVDVTGEATDKDAVTTLNTLLQFFAAKQGQPLTPEEKLVMNKVLTLTGAVSPLELSNVASQPSPMPPSVPQPVT